MNELSTLLFHRPAPVPYGIGHVHLSELRPARISITDDDDAHEDASPYSLATEHARRCRQQRMVVMAIISAGQSAGVRLSDIQKALPAHTKNQIAHILRYLRQRGMIDLVGSYNKFFYVAR